MKQMELFPQTPSKTKLKPKKPKLYDKTNHLHAPIAPTARSRHTTDRTDDELVTQAVAGDKFALNTLLARHEKKLITQLRIKFRDAELAKDMTQEALLNAFKALPNFRGNSKFSTWLYRIGINATLNHFTAMKRRPPLQDLDTSEQATHRGQARLTDTFTPELVMISEQKAKMLAQQVETLPPDLRQCLEMRELEGLTYEQIAERSQCPIGTVRSRLFRAREHIGIRP